MPGTLRLLVSVRNLAEARLAAEAGVDFIDLKDPADGALGALPVARIAEIAADLRARPGTPPSISATTGDLASHQVDDILARVQAVAATGVDLVKVGIDGGPASPALLTALAMQADRGIAVVPVLIVDHGVDQRLVTQALSYPCFPALMLDTAGKLGGSLLQRRPAAELAAFIATVHAAPRGAQPVLAGLAGALRTDDLPALHRLAPDFAGFRSAVCSQGRAAALDPARLAALCAANRTAPLIATPG